jgi:AcrR family transcriptional regulator
MASVTRRRSSSADRHAAVEERMLSAVEELLRDGATTYTELGVEQLAAAGGISRSGFYLYFRDKVDLLLRLGDRVKSASFEAAHSWDPTGPDGGPEGLARVYERIFRVYRERGTLMAAINEVAAYDAAARAWWLKSQQAFLDHMVELLVAEQRAGRTPADLNPVQAAEVIVRGGAELILQRAGSNDDRDDAALALEMAYGYWYGYFRRPARI